MHKKVVKAANNVQGDGNSGFPQGSGGAAPPLKGATLQSVGVTFQNAIANIADLKQKKANKAGGDADLVRSIAANGLINPIVVMPDNSLVAGHRRLEACRALGWTQIPVRMVAANLASTDKSSIRLAAELIQIDENLVRKHLTVLEQGELLLRRDELLTALGLRAPAHRPKKGAASAALLTTNQIAADVGLSERTAQDRKSVVGRLCPKARDILRNHTFANNLTELRRLSSESPDRQVTVATDIVHNGAKDIAGALYLENKRNVKKQLDDLKANPPQLPPGRFEVIVMDVPWKINDSMCPYPTMTLEKIAALTVPAADDCVLFFWTINKYLLRDTAPLLDGWGFKEVGIITWFKGRDENTLQIGTGSHLRGQTEHVVMAVKGKPRFRDVSQGTALIGTPNSTIDIADTCLGNTYLDAADFLPGGAALFGQRRQHSQKPESFYDVVAKLCSHMPRKLDYFSRTKRDGWETFGNDTDRLPLDKAA